MLIIHLLTVLTAHDVSKHVVPFYDVPAHDSSAFNCLRRPKGYPCVTLIGHDTFDRATCRATLGLLFAQVAWLRGYDVRQSTRLKLIPSCPAGRVIGLGNSGLSAPDYFCPAIIGEKLEATDARWLWMECSISYIFCQLRLIHSRSINI